MDFYVGYGWLINVHEFEASAISDICTQCQGAVPGGDCTNAEGIELPRACCDCTDTALAPDGTCRRGEQIVASMCCDCTSATLDRFGVCRRGAQIVATMCCA